MTIRLYLDEDMVQQRYSVGEQLRRLLRLIDTLTAEEMRNRIEFLSAWT